MVSCGLLECHLENEHKIFSTSDGVFEFFLDLKLDLIIN